MRRCALCNSWSMLFELCWKSNATNNAQINAKLVISTVSYTSSHYILTEFSSNAIKIIKIQKFFVIFSHLIAPFFIWFGLFWQSLSLCSFVCCLCAFSFFLLFQNVFARAIESFHAYFSASFLFWVLLHRALSIGEETLCSFLCMYNNISMYFIFFIYYLKMPFDVHGKCFNGKRDQHWTNRIYVRIMALNTEKK